MRTICPILAAIRIERDVLAATVLPKSPFGKPSGI
jgi:hypothetical protein